MTAPGDLNRRLVLEAPAETADGAGGVTVTYNAVATLWAKVEPVSARSVVVADAPGATVTHRITVRSYALITTRHRFVEDARVYRIVTLRDDATRRFLVIGAEERTDWGVMKEKIRTDLRRFLTKQTFRCPLIMPVILEI